MNELQAYNALRVEAERIGAAEFASGRYVPERDARGRVMRGYEITPQHRRVIAALPMVLDGSMPIDEAMAVLLEVANSDIPDLRHDHERSAAVADGKVYLRGQKLQVWWERDAAGRTFNNGNGGDLAINGRETWTFPAHIDANARFDEFTERHATAL